MATFEFTTTETANTYQFLNFDAGVCGYVTLHDDTYTIDRFVDDNDETIDYMFDRADSLKFEADLDAYLESERDLFNEWDAVSGV